MNKELDFAIKFIEHECKGKITIERNYGELRPVKCHAKMINQVFINIFLNAIYSIKDKGSIVITTSMQGDNVWVVIADDGCGIALDTIDKIFDPFFSTKPAGEGTGLGLGISYSIVMQYKGHITIESVQEEGTTAMITLPMYSPDND